MSTLMATPQPAPGTFPATLDQVNPSERVEQRFGWLPSYFAALAIPSAVASFLPGNLAWSHEPSAILAAVSLTAAGPLLLWWEFRRRRRRTVLVPRGGVVGIYRLGRFVQAMGPDEMRVRKLSFINTLRQLLAPAVLAVLFLVWPLFDDKANWLASVVGVLILIPCASGMRTRFQLAHCIIPGGKYPEELMLKNTDVPRLFRV